MKITDNISIKIYHDSGNNHSKGNFLHSNKVGWKPSIKKHYQQPTTKVEVYKDGELIGTGVAKCSFEDNFSRVTGRSLAWKRVSYELVSSGALSEEESDSISLFLTGLPSYKNKIDNLLKNIANNLSKLIFNNTEDASKDN